MNNKILASLEEWDSILNYYRPNGSSKTWYLEELKVVTPPLMWGNWNIFKENGDMFNDYNNTVNPHNLNKILEYVTIDDIKNRNHLYIITVYNPLFFQNNRNIGFKCISEKYKKDIRNGKSKIVILYLYEGYSGMVGNDDFEIIDEWRIKEKFPLKSVYCITGNLIGDIVIKKKKLDLEVFGVQIFDRLNSNYNTNSIVNFEPKDDKYLYLSYNRAPRIQRIMFVYELIKKGLFDKGLLSLGKPSIESINNIKFVNFNNNIDIDIDIIDKIINESPFIIDKKYDLNYNLACNISLDDYKKTFISIVTETLVDNDTLFLSEKIWKPIIIGHPFILYGNPNTLKYLKKLGFKTFDKWIDESYDCECDNGIRLNMIVEEIYKFQKLSIGELKKIRLEMNYVCEHNNNLYYKLLNENWTGDVNNNLIKYLEYIWNTFDKDDKNIIKSRKYLPTLSELIDRLSICQLKEVFITEHKDEYAKEIQDILHDIDMCIDDSEGEITSDTLRAIVVLSQMNLHIWHNESNYRNGISSGNNLELTHGLNGIRNTAKNKIQEIVGGRKDYKIDCLAAEFKDWEISWNVDSMSVETNRNNEKLTKPKKKLI